MPGPLTVILPKKDTVPASVTGGLETVAVRCPAHPVARALIRAAGVAVAAPSANRSGKPSPTCARDAFQDLDGRVDLIIDGGPCEIGLESTIVLLQGDEDAVLLRPGAVTYDALCCVCRSVTVPDSVLHTLSESERPLSPGMKYRHYAPDAPLVLLDGPADAVLAFLQKAQQTERCTVLCYEEERPFLSPDRLLCVGGRDDLAAQAQSVFRLLREADRTDGRIVYAHLPPRHGLGLALYNRMIRAAAHQIRTVDPLPGTAEDANTTLKKR
jgi:L-threonylcarbamoyladenylate synthase